MTPFFLSFRTKTYRITMILLSILIGCRVLMMFALPHIDTSEARYAEISRKMAETGDWITPQFDYGIPFWAKPPLSMWMSALGMNLFGVNEFGSRIIIFLAAMAILWLVARAVRGEKDKTTGLVAATLLMAMPLFFYCSAAVMTDLALALGTTLAMVAFRLAVLENSRCWGYAFFVGLAIGLLAKGPLALVLALPPVAVWILLAARWRSAWKSVPWISGTLLMLIMALPWYLAAEHKTPGFLDYFIIGEHWKRFTVRGWQGDLYGNAHSKIPGTIWVYLILVTFPWCLGIFAVPLRKWQNLKSWLMSCEGYGLYWLLWALWPVVFFTPSRNIIATYPLPALPALAILLAVLVREKKEKVFSWSNFHPFHPALVGLGVGAMVVATLGALIAPGLSPKRSEKELVEIFRKAGVKEDHLLYFGIRRYSAEFYSEGEAENSPSITVLIEKLDAPGHLFVATTSQHFDKIPPNIQRRFVRITHWSNPRLNLYRERDDTPTMTGIDPAKTYPIGS